MGIITKEVEIRPTGKSIQYYKDKGYDAAYLKPVMVKVEDLPICSCALIETTCDYCGKLKKPIKYVTYNKETKNGTTKCCCMDCAALKRGDAIFEKYGYRSALQVPEIKDKTARTNLKRYGATYPCGNAEVSKKQKETNLKKYGAESPLQSEEIKEKIKKTNLERYGVANIFLNAEVKEKIKQTNLERYGVENVLLNKEIKAKRDMTLLERFGTLYPLQNEECLHKLKNTNLKRYGVEFASQLEENKQKIKQTSLKKYRVENPFQNEEVKAKAKKTNLERYGVESVLSLPSFHEHSRRIDMDRYGVYHHLQNPEILAKQKETLFKKGICPTSKQQFYLCAFYGGELNYPIKNYNVDICLLEENIVIEYDGGGHDLSVKRGNITQEEFNQKEIIRNNIIKKEGYKQMRIISTKDFLPSDNILLKMLLIAKEYFHTTSHTWINFDIDNSIMINAENKNVGGVFFDYGQLRKIKEIV